MEAVVKVNIICSQGKSYLVKEKSVNFKVNLLCQPCTMSSGKSLQLQCILPFGMLCLSAIGMMFVKIMLAVGILVV